MYPVSHIWLINTKQKLAQSWDVEPSTEADSTAVCCDILVSLVGSVTQEEVSCNYYYYYYCIIMNKTCKHLILYHWPWSPLQLYNESILLSKLFKVFFVHKLNPNNLVYHLDEE